MVTVITPDQQPDGVAPEQEIETPASAGPKPTKSLPAKKMSMQKQAGLLQAFGILSTKELKPVPLKKLAEVAGLHQNSVSACNPFFIESGLVTKNGHQFTPAVQVVDYSARLEWNSEDAGHKLQPIIAESWFAKTLLPRLQLRKHLEDEAIAVLADEAGASPDYRTQLVMLLEYLELSGLVRKDNGTVEIVRTPPAPPQQKNDTPKDPPPNPRVDSPSVLCPSTSPFQGKHKRPLAYRKG